MNDRNDVLMIFHTTCPTWLMPFQALDQSPLSRPITVFTTPRMRLTAVVTAPEITCQAPTTTGIATCIVAPTA